MPSLQMQELTLAQILEHAATLAVPGTRRILGFTGAPGAGKSTVASQVSDALGPGLATFVPMDGFHLANNVLVDLKRRDRKGAHDTFDDAGYANLIARLRSQSPTATPEHGEVIYAPQFRRELEEPVGSSIPVYGNVPLIVTEGNYLLLNQDAWPQARKKIDEVWFLSPSDEVRHERLVRRHQEYGKSRESAELWALGSDQRNAELIESTAKYADRIVRIAE